MKKSLFRSGCPIACSLDLVGDKWSLLIVRDMLTGKKTFKEFSASPEGIAPGILSSRLKTLESLELVTKRKLPKNRKENIYLLTEKGISLVPMVTEIVLWSDKIVRTLNAEMIPLVEMGFVGDKSKMVANIQKNYRAMVKQTIG